MLILQDKQCSQQSNPTNRRVLNKVSIEENLLKVIGCLF